MERKEGDTYKYGAYFNKTQTYKYYIENGQSLECICIVEISLWNKKLQAATLLKHRTKQ